MKLTSLKVKTRQQGSKSIVNALRRKGCAPAVFYGRENEPVNLEVDLADFRSIDVPGNRMALVRLEVEGGESHDAIVKEVQRDIITGVVLHIDFQQVLEDHPVKVVVPIHLNGEAVGVKSQGGLLFQDRKSVVVSCMPKDIPTSYEVDVSEWEASTTMYVRELGLGNAKLVTPSRAVIFSISKARGEDEEGTKTEVVPEVETAEATAS